MKKSIIYFVVALTLVSLGLTLVPSVLGQTQNIKIVSYSYYVDSIGVLDVVGEIQNVGSSTIGSVLLTGSIYSSDGAHQADSSARVWGSSITPQQKAPFYMEFYTPTNSSDGSWLSVTISKVDLTVSQADATNNYQYPDLKITSSSASVDTTADNKGVYWASGTIQNTGNQTAQSITVLGTFYNAAGTTVAVGYTDVLTPTSLSPSATTNFKVGAFDYNQTLASSDKKIASYSILVQVQGPILQGTAPAITPSPTPESSQSSSSPTPQSSDNKTANSSNSWLIYAAVIAIVIVAIAGTMLTLKSASHKTPKNKQEHR